MAPKGVFLVHGDAWNFDGAFRGGTSANESIAVYLASQGIDVWGIDLGWTLVGPGVGDFSFMRGWGLQRDIDDTEKALTFARSVRAQTGSSASKLALLAWSRGGWIGYGLLNEEAQKPDAQRQVRAFVPVDTTFKVDDSAARARTCAVESAVNNQIQSGVYETDNRSLAQLGGRAKTAPDGPAAASGAPETNLQASLTLGAAPSGAPFAPNYHFVAGSFPHADVTHVPTGLVYTDVSRWNDFLASATPFEPSLMIRDTLAISCDPGLTSPFDNHLKDVTVPVLYEGAGGGFGRSGLYSLTLLGSKDVSTHLVSFYPSEMAALDFGHVDLFYARDAQQLVWAPIYQWLYNHS